MTDWRVYLRNRTLQRVSELTDYVSFSAVMALNDVGKWTLTLPGDSANASLINIDLGMGVILTADGDVVMSGPAETTEYTESADGDMLEIQGIDDTGLLAYRNAWPSAYPPWTSDTVDNFSGGAEAAMRYFVNQNAVGLAEGGNAFPGHEIPQLYLGAWSDIGQDVEVSARFDNLLGLLQGIAVQSGLRFQIRQHPTIAERLEFIVNAPADKTGLVRFSKDLGNVKSVKAVHGRPAANFIVVAGEGQGTERLFATLMDLGSAQQFGLREYFYDLRQSIGLTEMGAKAAEKMAELGEAFSFEVEPLDGGPFQFRDDWDVGDRVTVQWTEQTVVGYVGSVPIDLSSDGAVVMPTITNLFTVPRQSDNLVEMVRRIGHLERTAEMMTVDQIIGIGAPVYAPINHDTFHDDRFALIDHDMDHDDRFALIHSHPYAATEHDTAHDDRFSLLAHTHTALTNVNGTYTGNGGTTARQITVGFIPRQVTLFNTTTGITMYITIATSGSIRLSTGVSNSTAVHLHSSDGFTVADGNNNGNDSGETYAYVAIR